MLTGIFDNDVDATGGALVLPGSGLRYTIGDQLMGTDVLRALGYRGQGIRIGVMSDGADSFESVINTELPQLSELTPGKVFRNEELRTRKGDEGTAMMEIIHDIAPDAELYFFGVGAGQYVRRTRLVRAKQC